MIVLNKKTFEELTEFSTKELQAIGFTTKPGAIAKLFLNIINKNIANLYDALTVNHLRAFLSTSDTDALDAIGELLQCKRDSGEKDEDYKYRISNQCLVLATSNETSIRLAALCTDGVDDVLLKPYSMGCGTYTVIIITDPKYNQDEVLKAVETQVAATTGYGIRYRIDSPTLTPVKISVRLNIKNGVSDTKKQEIKYLVKEKLTDYFTTLKVGEDLLVDKITQVIMNCDENILSYQTTKLSLGGEKSIYVNQSCRWFERFFISSDIDNIIVQ